MPQIKISLTLLATVVAAAAHAQSQIFNTTSARAYNPAHAETTERFRTVAEWELAHRRSDIVATSESHPFDPPINIATAMSQFDQPDYGDATMRGMSFVLSDYSSQANGGGYSALSIFLLRQQLEVDLTAVAPGFSIVFKLAVPMHGFMAARGGANGNGEADARLNVQASKSNFGGLLDEVVGDIHLEGTGANEFNYTASGDWAADVRNATVNLPTGDQPRTSLGVELNSFFLLDLGVLQTGTSQSFDITYQFDTSAYIPSPSGLFALSDFSGTGAMTFLGFDEAGNPFRDFTVRPAGEPVPEPASLAAIGLGLAAFARRRRK